MHIICNQSLLLNAINIALKACSTKTTKPILECILLKAQGQELTLTGNSIELGIESTIIANVEEEGIVALESKIFSEIIRKMPGENVEITVDDKFNTTIVSETAKFQIPGREGKDFPEIPTVQADVSCTINQYMLKEMINQTIFSIAQDETRPIFTGEMFEINNDTLNLVAVDGFRIAFRTAKLSNENDSVRVVLPGKTLQEISRILSSEEHEVVTIHFGDKHVLFDLGQSKVVSNLLQGDFLKYETVFSSDYETKILANKKNLLMSLERAALISREGKKNPIKISITADKMIIATQTDLGTSREEIDVDLEGKELTIAFNPKYLIDALKAIEDERVYLQFISSYTPCIIHPQEGEKYKYLILPVRVNN